MSLTLRSMKPQNLKKHPALVSLFGILGFGVVLAGGYLARLAFYSPDVAWDKSKVPWEEYASKRYKFYASENMKTVKDPRPKIDW